MKKKILIISLIFSSLMSFGQYNECNEAYIEDAIDLSCEEELSFLTNEETASGFFSDFYFDCDISSSYQTDFWFKFTAFDDDIIVDLETASSSVAFVILDNVDCDSKTANEIVCSIKNVNGYEEFVHYNTDMIIGNEYYLVVLMEEAEDIENICIKSPNIPKNNECSGAIELFAGVEIESSNFGAQSALFDSECNVGIKENDVWFKFNYVAEDRKNMIVLASPLDEDKSEKFSLSIYDGCNGKELACTTEAPYGLILSCLPDGVYWIQVGSTDLYEGEFNIKADILNIDNGCEEVSKAPSLLINTTKKESPEFDKCIEGCFENASPEDSVVLGNASCDFSKKPTVWYKIKTDNLAKQLFVKVLPKGNWNPMISIFKGDPNCNLVNAADNGNTCSSTLNYPNYYSVEVFPNSTYYIVVSAGGDIEISEFEICFATVGDIAYCEDDDIGCTPDPRFLIEVIGREYPELDQQPNGRPFVGPFLPGEELTIHMEFIYDETEGGNGWLLGFVPGFSTGFDIRNFDFEANAPSGSGPFGGIAEWFPQDGECGAGIMYEPGLDYLCTYKEDGVIKLCNSLCEDCNKCTPGMDKWDELPGMYAWVSDGSTIDCRAGDCSPKRRWGIGTDYSELVWDFSIKVKEFSEIIDCNIEELRVDIQPFNDGVAGCWDAGKLCYIIQKQIGPSWPIKCDVVPKAVFDKRTFEICSEKEAKVSISVTDKLEHDVLITHEDFGLVEGMKDREVKTPYTFIDNISIIDQDVCEPVTVFYYTRLNENGYEEIWDTLEITVYPKIQLEILVSDETNSGANDGTATAKLDCIDRDYQYLWSTGEDSLMISGLAPGNYTLIVTDEYGCSASQTITVRAYECSDLNVKCQIDSMPCSESCLAALSILSVENAIPPLNYLWSTGDTSKSIDSLCQGVYSIHVTDVNGCEVEDSFEIIAPSPLVSNIYGANESKFDGNDGIAGINPQGGVPPYSCIWARGDTTFVIDSLSPGVYFVNIIDSKFCSIQDSIIIYGYSCNLEVEEKLSNAKCFGECNGEVEIISVNNGTKPFKYSWSNGENTAFINSLCAGKYVVTITDSLSCTEIDTFIIDQPDEIMFVVDTIIDITDSGTGAIFISVDNSTRYNYEWNGPNGFIKTSRNILGLTTAGCYTLILTDTLSNCKIDSTICISDETAIFENNLSKRIKVFPNPTSNHFFIDFGDILTDDIKIELFDISNRKVLIANKRLKKRLIDINVKSMTPGLYFIKIKLESGVVYKKIVVR